MNSSRESLNIFAQFFKRDCYVQWQQKNRYIIDYFILYAPLYTMVYCYLQPRIFFGPNGHTLGTTVFVGTLALEIIILSFRTSVDLILDLEKTRFTEYQITLINPRLFVLQKMLFAACLTFCITLPFYPIAKLIAGSNFDTSKTCWPLVYMVVAAGSLFSASFNLACLFVAKKYSRVPNMWMRVYNPLIFLGGFWIPFHVMQRFSPFLGTIVLFNPVLYLTEGLKTAFMGGNQFLPVGYCVAGLLTYAMLCMIIAWYHFKKNVDHL